jgi:hypothetical protein
MIQSSLTTMTMAFIAAGLQPAKDLRPQASIQGLTGRERIGKLTPRKFAYTQLLGE